MQCKAKFRDLNTHKEFWLKFDCEYKRDKFIRRLRFSKKLVVIPSSYRDDIID